MSIIDQKGQLSDVLQWKKILSLTPQQRSVFDHNATTPKSDDRQNHRHLHCGTCMPCQRGHSPLKQLQQNVDLLVVIQGRCNSEAESTRRWHCWAIGSSPGLKQSNALILLKLVLFWLWHVQNSCQWIHLQLTTATAILPQHLPMRGETGAPPRQAC